MNAKRWLVTIAGVLCVSLAQGTYAKDEPAAGTAASKVEMRGKNLGIKVVEMRVVKENDIMIVQADFENTNSKDRFIYYRFRWVDANGNQVGDGEAFKQVSFLGKQKKTLKAVAPKSSVTDFTIEMSAELQKR